MKLKQRGGTFLGLIIGATIGLAVALAVAIYVAEVPVPFVNKNATRTDGQDAAEAERNRNWDPNAALGGRNGARPSSGATTGGTVAPTPPPAPIPGPAETDPGASTTATRSTPVPPPTEVGSNVPRPTERTAERPDESTPVVTRPASTTRPPSSDPLGDFAAARAGMSKPPAPTAASADVFTYFVQAGAFRAANDAEAQRARLSLLGVEARVTEREQAGRTVFRVRVGPFQNRDAAARVKERLDGNGLDSALVRVAR
ncbi:SPOR domain-containing protein [Ottowia sp.]|uniref:SPOR domain-containing protein n=1 Tax=Ottowia sp. TaxID=1898956 RepID=UPI003A8C4E47